MPGCLENISTVFNSRFYPQETPYRAFVIKDGENYSLQEEISQSSLALRVFDFALWLIARICFFQDGARSFTLESYKERVGQLGPNERVIFEHGGRQIYLRTITPQNSKVIPLRTSLFLTTYRGKGIGKIGSDTCYNFKERLKLADGTPYTPNPNDLLCPISVQEGPLEAIGHLPLSLLDGKKEDERLFLFYDDQALEITLHQMGHWKRDGGQVEFETMVNQLKEQNQNADYLFQKDIPKNTLQLGLYCLSETTQICTLNENKEFTKLASLTEEKIGALEANYPRSNTIQLKINATENKFLLLTGSVNRLQDIEFLIDGCDLYLCVTPTSYIQTQKENAKSLIIKQELSTKCKIIKLSFSKPLTQEILQSWTIAHEGGYLSVSVSNCSIVSVS